MKFRIGLFSVLLACGNGLSSGAPLISQVVNAANYRVGPVAQGSIVTIFGSGLGPAQGVSATDYPLATTLAGVSVRTFDIASIVSHANSISAIPMYVQENQVNLVLPSNVPTGRMILDLTYNGATSAGIAIDVVSASPGLFTFTSDGSTRAAVQNFVSASEQPINLPSVSARPGQVMIAYLTGLGPIRAPDNLAAPAGDFTTLKTEIVVGTAIGRRLYAGRSPCCSGLDQVVFEIPPDAPLGCNVGLSIRAGDDFSNGGNISISATGGLCADPVSVPPATCGWQTVGTVLLFQNSLRSPGFPEPNESVVETSTAYFQLWPKLCEDPPPPPLGVCTVIPRAVLPIVPLGSFAQARLTGTNADPAQVAQNGLLDAGDLTLTGPTGKKMVFRGFGGFNKVTPSNPAFFTSGSYTLSAPGGVGVGSFSADFEFRPVRVTAPALGGVVPRDTPLTISWSGGTPDRDVVRITGYALDTWADVGSSFTCTLSASQSSFTVPVSMLSQLLDFAPYLSVNAIVAPAQGSAPSFSASGLDAGSIIPSSEDTISATFAPAAQ